MESTRADGRLKTKALIKPGLGRYPCIIRDEAGSTNPLWVHRCRRSHHVGREQRAGIAVGVKVRPCLILP